MIHFRTKVNKKKKKGSEIQPAACLLLFTEMDPSKSHQTSTISLIELTFDAHSTTTKQRKS